jgi:hypothetical protein
LEACPYGYAGNVVVVLKSPSADGDNAVGYSYIGKVAERKSAASNGGNAVSYGYAGKTAAAVKSTIPDASNAVGYGYAGKAELAKSANLNAGNAVWYGYIAAYFWRD